MVTLDNTSKSVVGDTVMLNSGGPEMKVLLCLANGMLLCQWEDTEGVNREQWFMSKTVTVVRRGRSSAEP
jgi:uncharacterized protein YodC (DUF2158 family)